MNKKRINKEGRRRKQVEKKDRKKAKREKKERGSKQTKNTRTQKIDGGEEQQRTKKSLLWPFSGIFYILFACTQSSFPTFSPSSRQHFLLNGSLSFFTTSLLATRHRQLSSRVASPYPGNDVTRWTLEPVEPVVACCHFQLCCTPSSSATSPPSSSSSTPASPATTTCSTACASSWSCTTSPSLSASESWTTSSPPGPSPKALMSPRSPSLCILCPCVCVWRGSREGYLR